MIALAAWLAFAALAISLARAWSCVAMASARAETVPLVALRLKPSMESAIAERSSSAASAAATARFLIAFVADAALPSCGTLQPRTIRLLSARPAGTFGPSEIHRVRRDLRDPKSPSNCRAVVPPRIVLVATTIGWK